MTVHIDELAVGVWSVWAADDQHVVQTVLQRAERPTLTLVQEQIDGSVVSVLRDELGVELARSGMDPP